MMGNIVPVRYSYFPHGITFYAMGVAPEDSYSGPSFSGLIHLAVAGEKTIAELYMAPLFETMHFTANDIVKKDSNVTQSKFYKS